MFSVHRDVFYPTTWVTKTFEPSAAAPAATVTQRSQTLPIPGLCFLCSSNLASRATVAAARLLRYSCFPLPCGTDHHVPACARACVSAGNAESVAGLKDRVKAAQDKTKDLLKALNGSRETLNAIPNGRSVQKNKNKNKKRGSTWLWLRAFTCAWARKRDEDWGWINTRSGSVWRMSATTQLTESAMGGKGRRGRGRSQSCVWMSTRGNGEEISYNNCKWVTPRTLTTTRSILIKMPVSGFPNNAVQRLFNYWIHNVPNGDTVIYRQRSINLCTYSSILFYLFYIFIFFSKFTSLVGWLFSLEYIYAHNQALHTWRWYIHSYL